MCVIFAPTWLVCDFLCRCVVAHSYVTWLFHTWHELWPSRCCTSRTRCVMCVMTRPYVTRRIYMWRDVLPWLICLFLCAVAHSCVTWLIHTWHDAFICDMTRRSCCCINCAQHAGVLLFYCVTVILCACACACEDACTYGCAHACVRAHACVHAHAHVCVCACVCMHV